MSFNVRYGTADDGLDRWEFRRPRVLSMLEAHPADVIGLQEALSFQIDELSAAGDYVPVGVGREDGRSGGEHAAILYNPARLRLLSSNTFWLSATPELVASRTWDHRVTRICTWAFFRDLANEREFYHFNLHLDHESAFAREKGVELVLQRVGERNPDAPVFVTGDFNCGEADPVVAKMANAGFQDSYRVAHPDAVHPVTFNGWNPAPTGEKIDYIFVQPDVRVSSAEIIQDSFDGHWSSDHFPITASIEL